MFWGILVPARTILAAGYFERTRSMIAWRFARVTSGAVPRSPSFAPSSRTNTSSLWRRTRSEEHTSELQSLRHLVCRLLFVLKIGRPPKSTLFPSPAHFRSAAFRRRASHPVVRSQFQDEHVQPLAQD